MKRTVLSIFSTTCFLDNVVAICLCQCIKLDLLYSFLMPVHCMKALLFNMSFIDGYLYCFWDVFSGPLFPRVWGAQKNVVWTQFWTEHFPNLPLFVLSFPPFLSLLDVSLLLFPLIFLMLSLRYVCCFKALLTESRSLWISSANKQTDYPNFTFFF